MKGEKGDKGDSATGFSIGMNPPQACNASAAGFIWADSSTGNVYTCDPSRNKWLSQNSDVIFGERDRNCAKDKDLDTFACTTSFGSDVNSGQVGFYIADDITITGYGFSGKNVSCSSGSFDIEVWSSGSNSNNTNFSKEVDVASNLNNIAHNARDLNIDVNGNQYIIVGLDNNCNGSIQDHSIQLYYKTRSTKIASGGSGSGSPTCKTLDFNSLVAGTNVTNQFPGVTISASNNNGGNPDKAITFNSASPTGGDPDLGTPNQDFGGAGVGNGGRAGQVGENNSSLGNLLILAENDTDSNGDGLVDNPDDEASGGTISFSFAQPVKIVDLNAIDIEDSSSRVRGLNSSGSQVFAQNFSAHGDNSVETVNVNQAAFETTTLEVELRGSGAVDNIMYCSN